MTKRNDLTLPGALLIVISQLFSSYQSSEKLSGEIVKFRDEFKQSIIDRDTLFVRKVELAKLYHKIDSLSTKVNRISNTLSAMNKGEYHASNP